MITAEKLADAGEIAEVRDIIQRHLQFTGSTRAEMVLDKWEDMLPQFVKIIPKDYKRIIQSIARAKQMGLSGDEAIMAAFEENIKDVSRVSGN
jgi:glutamate synthase (NADPH/NADH) large chain